MEQLSQRLLNSHHNCSWVDSVKSGFQGVDFVVRFEHVRGHWCWHDQSKVLDKVWFLGPFLCMHHLKIPSLPDECVMLALWLISWSFCRFDHGVCFLRFCGVACHMSIQEPVQKRSCVHAWCYCCWDQSYVVSFNQVHYFFSRIQIYLFDYFEWAAREWKEAESKNCCRRSTCDVFV